MSVIAESQRKITADNILTKEYSSELSKYNNLIDSNILTEEQIKALLIAKESVENKQQLDQQNRDEILKYLEDFTKPINLEDNQINSISQYFNFERKTNTYYNKVITIDSKNYQIVQNNGDGNCLFHSLREALKDINYTNRDVLGEIDFNN